ncbi:MAG: hypothetical protein OXG04_09680 [Acidobacteria bacterium]|nr:hypothetical protein [Acidobacteriota bacterium]
MTERLNARPDALARAREIALRIAERVAADDGVTITMLGAVLWMADTTAWAELGRPLTGISYRNAGKGPEPELMSAIELELLQHQAAQLLLDGNAAVRLKARRPARMERFSAEERSVIDRCADTAAHAESTDPAAFLRTNRWALAPVNSLIPYEAIFVSRAGADPADIDRTGQLVAEGSCSRAGAPPMPTPKRAKTVAESKVR